MPISRDTIELVRDRSRIEEIVRRYVPSLKKRGANFVGLCPFHKEKTPSFTVSAEKQIFYCFGCHTGGNVFAFMAKLERLLCAESV
ncbi:MAG TPA: CHC2 zinc finger domain-containing protein, partial [Spirochaetota bacterium]|nr:CHC2 zinc finger domain-containing protein [Spirochaetota bacterium]